MLAGINISVHKTHTHLHGSPPAPRGATIRANAAAGRLELLPNFSQRGDNITLQRTQSITSAAITREDLPPVHLP